MPIIDKEGLTLRIDPGNVLYMKDISSPILGGLPATRKATVYPLPNLQNYKGKYTSYLQLKNYVSYIFTDI